MTVKECVGLAILPDQKEVREIDAYPGGFDWVIGQATTAALAAALRLIHQGGGQVVGPILVEVIRGYEVELADGRLTADVIKATVGAEIGQ